MSVFVRLSEMGEEGGCWGSREREVGSGALRQRRRSPRESAYGPGHSSEPGLLQRHTIQRAPIVLEKNNNVMPT